MNALITVGPRAGSVGLPAIRFYYTIQRSPVRGSGSGEPVVGAGRPQRHIEV